MDEPAQPAPEFAPPAGDGPPPPAPDRSTLWTVAACLVIAATSWFLLKELAPLLRPLLLAVFLGYVILPGQQRLRQTVAGPGAIPILAALTIGATSLLSLLIYTSAVELNDELPRLVQRGQRLFDRANHFYSEHAPAWLIGDPGDAAAARAQTFDRVQVAARTMLDLTADGLTGVVLVGIYLLFLLMEARQVRGRIESGFSSDRADQILAVIARINHAMASYLRVKVKASLVLAIPVVLILWAFGVKFALLWGVLTFFLNFIPYIGSVIACGLPILLAFLQLDSIATAATVSVLLVTMHITSAYLVEPSMTGRAVGLSPLAILGALSFWGLCWGLIGMLLAVPLTVMLKIVLENVEFTRPFAHLLSDE